MKRVSVLVGLPQNRLWESLVNVKEAPTSELEERLATLEAKSGNSAIAGFLPGAGIIMGSFQ